MPGFILHLLHGKFFLDNFGSVFSENETDQFRMGILMPDVYKAKNEYNESSHFYPEEQSGKILKLPDTENFRYRSMMDEPFVFGYVMHLYLDSVFFQDYFLRYVRFEDKYGNSVTESRDVCRVYLTKSSKYITVDELFSEEYLYGDYTSLNRYLIKKYDIGNVREVYVNNPVNEVDVKDFHFIQESLEKYISDSSEAAELKVFTAESLEEAVFKYAFGFKKWMDHNKKIRGIDK